MGERECETATRRLRADRSRQTRDTPANATIGGSGGIYLANATIGGSGGISQTLQLQTDFVKLQCRPGQVRRQN